MSTYELSAVYPKKWGVERVKGRPGGALAVRCMLAFDHGIERDAMMSTAGRLLQLPMIRTEDQPLFIRDTDLTEGRWGFSVASHRPQLPVAPRWWPFGRAKRAQALEAELHLIMNALTATLVLAWTASGIKITPTEIPYSLVIK